MTIEGAVGKATQVTSDLIKPSVNVAGLTPGAHDLRETVALPTDTTLESVSPETVTMTMTANPNPPTKPSDGETPPGGGTGGGSGH